MAFIEYTYQSTYPELFKTEEALPQMGDNEVLVELFFGVCIGGFDHKLVETTTLSEGREYLCVHCNLTIKSEIF